MPRVCVFVCVRVCESVSVSVCARERDIDREKKKESKRFQHLELIVPAGSRVFHGSTTDLDARAFPNRTGYWSHASERESGRVCVEEREREKERERERESERDRDREKRV